ncbi:MAG TPA: NYN domain-containing protein, partial [Phycisphaerae bacterium]
MHYLVDTYNLLHAAISSGGPLSDLNVRRFCQYLAATPVSVKATLILDGRAKPDEPSENEFPDISLVYSGTGVSADTVIAQMVERSTTRKKLTVITND